MIRRVSPFAAPAFALALILGAVLGGWGSGWSAAVGIVVVFANFVASGLSLSSAARISPIALYAVGLGGFVIRLALIGGLLLALQSLDSFSPTAFVAAVVPTSAVLLGLELRVLSDRRLQADLWYFGEEPS
jgi:hypothetical protein